MAYLYFESFVVLMKGTAKRLEGLSVLMTVRKPIIRLLAKTLYGSFKLKLIFVLLFWVPQCSYRWCEVAAVCGVPGPL